MSAALRLIRFDRTQRLAHWATAGLFIVLMATALPLYFPAVERVLGRHVLIVQIHLWAGIALPVPLLVALAGPWGRRMRRDLRRVNRWTDSELAWLRTLGREAAPGDKFNPGQKLNAVFVAASIVVMLGTGIVLEWFGLFPLSWRGGATLVHEVLAFLIFLVVLGHVALALSHREALRSMLRGWVSEDWARRHAAQWLAEEQAPPGRG